MIPSKEAWLTDRRHRPIRLHSWIPPKPWVQLTVIHGYAEHLGCYAEWAKALNQQGVAVHALDLQGHGLSGGIRGHIYSFQDFINLVLQHRQENPFAVKGIPQFLFGHSMGGLTSLHLAQQAPNAFQGVILSSPLCGFGAKDRAFQWLAELLADKFASQPIPKPPGGYAALSRDPKRHQQYIADPLRLTGLTPKLYLEMIQWSAEALRVAPSIGMPLLMMMTSQDQVVSPAKQQAVFQALGSPDKTLVTFTQAAHELIQEPEQAQITPLVVDWLRQRL